MKNKKGKVFGVITDKYKVEPTNNGNYMVTIRKPVLPTMKVVKDKDGSFWMETEKEVSPVTYWNMMQEYYVNIDSVKEEKKLLKRIKSFMEWQRFLFDRIQSRLENTRQQATTFLAGEHSATVNDLSKIFDDKNWKKAKLTRVKDLKEALEVLEKTHDQLAEHKDKCLKQIKELSQKNKK